VVLFGELGGDFWGRLLGQFEARQRQQHAMVLRPRSGGLR